MSNSKYKDTLKYVNDCISHNEDYFENGIKNASVIRFIEQSGHSISNKEQFANMLLVEVTNNIPGHFSISKKQSALNAQGECWIHGCKEIQDKITEPHRNSMCDKKCTYVCKNCTAKQKIEDLSQNSIYSKWKVE